LEGIPAFHTPAFSNYLHRHATKTGVFMEDNKLSEKQERAIELLIIHGNFVRVAEELNIERSTLWRWRKEPRFATAYREARQAISERTRELLQLAATQAVKRLVELMNDSDVPASVQFASARSILDLHFRGMEIEDIQASVDELRQLIVRDSRTVKKGLRAV
jgi:hypothetical protein